MLGKGVSGALAGVGVWGEGWGGGLDGGSGVSGWGTEFLESALFSS